MYSIWMSRSLKQHAVSFLIVKHVHKAKETCHTILNLTFVRERQLLTEWEVAHKTLTAAFDVCVSCIKSLLLDEPASLKVYVS